MCVSVRECADYMEIVPLFECQIKSEVSASSLNVAERARMHVCVHARVRVHFFVYMRLFE